MTTLTIIRGPSGTGKSTIARHLGGRERINWFEADMYFDRNGHYEFDASRLGQAHGWCQEQVKRTLADGKDVIVSNTSTTMGELQNYLEIARETGAEIRIVRTPEPWHAEDLRDRNVHNVPLKALQRMINRYTPHEDEELWSDLSLFKE